MFKAHILKEASSPPSYGKVEDGVSLLRRSTRTYLQGEGVYRGEESGFNELVSFFQSVPEQMVPFELSSLIDQVEGKVPNEILRALLFVADSFSENKTATGMMIGSALTALFVRYREQIQTLMIFLFSHLIVSIANKAWEATKYITRLLTFLYILDSVSRRGEVSTLLAESAKEAITTGGNFFLESNIGSEVVSNVKYFEQTTADILSGKSFTKAQEILFSSETAVNLGNEFFSVVGTLFVMRSLILQLVGEKK